MTQNQIAYWANQEKGRSNRAQETETHRHNVATEGVEGGKLKETQRHNAATEFNESGKLRETSRHNLASEGQARYATDTSAAIAAADRVARTSIADKDREQRINSTDKDREQRYYDTDTRSRIASEDRTARAISDAARNVTQLIAPFIR